MWICLDGVCLSHEACTSTFETSFANDVVFPIVGEFAHPNGVVDETVAFDVEACALVGGCSFVRAHPGPDVY